MEGSLEGTGRLSCPERPLYFPRPVSRPQRPARQVLMEGIPEGDEWRLLRELHKLGLEEELLSRPFQSLSGGEQTRARLAALFLAEDGYPLIDEPTNHLDEEGRALAARYLRGLNRGFLLVYIWLLFYYHFYSTTTFFINCEAIFFTINSCCYISVSYTHLIFIISSNAKTIIPTTFIVLVIKFLQCCIFYNPF